MGLPHKVHPASFGRRSSLVFWVHGRHTPHSIEGVICNIEQMLNVRGATSVHADALAVKRSMLAFERNYAAVGRNKAAANVVRQNQNGGIQDLIRETKRSASQIGITNLMFDEKKLTDIYIKEGPSAVQDYMTREIDKQIR